ncbi:MAG: Fis family transcriptional regulator [Acidobacteria bacterium CG_4_9_14_3_um_filter_49_7]|nr:MAG: Fis family transcriptional regulator [Acidobacteria bacterium CG_4_9_14_3_um_filter_49_7]
MSERILVVDDERDIVEAIADILALEGYAVLKAYRGYDAVKTAVKEKPDLVILDVKMPIMDGMDTLHELRQKGFEKPVIIISGHGDVKTAVEAVRLGAFDFLEKPLSRNGLLIAVQNAVATAAEQAPIEPDAQDQIIGRDPAFIQCLRVAERIAPTTAPVLITGDTGTGKEIIARYIHGHSKRKKHFVEVNCAAIPDELIESELFGHVKGSFTGAISDKTGKFLAADGGTLFLDEIGDMSLKTQAKVLRAIQEKIIIPVGSNTPVSVNVRIISATNKDLAQEIEENRFREDLFYRLNVIELRMPSLSERKSDIPLMADHFAMASGKENGLKHVQLTEDAKGLLAKRDYPGNVRELKNLVERIVVISQKSSISMEDVKMILDNRFDIKDGEFLETSNLPVPPSPSEIDFFKINSLKEFRDRIERLFIIEKLKQTAFNISKTAEIMETPRSNLYKKLEQYDIDVKELEAYYGKQT